MDVVLGGNPVREREPVAEGIRSNGGSPVNSACYGHAVDVGSYPAYDTGASAGSMDTSTP
jgi:hypothetical protein